MLEQFRAFCEMNGFDLTMVMEIMRRRLRKLDQIGLVKPKTIDAIHMVSSTSLGSVFDNFIGQRVSRQNPICFQLDCYFFVLLALAL